MNSLDTIQAYAIKHWNTQRDNLRYTDTFWKLIDDCTLDIATATDFVEQHLHDGTVSDRVIAATLAGQLCNPLEPENNTYTDRIAKHIISAAAHETHVSVLSSIADALRFMELSPALFDTMYTLTYHENPDVRFYAARSLSNIVDDEYGNDKIIDRLVELSADKDADIRDWCLSGLSSLVEFYEIDRQKIRDAFLARVKDRHRDARAEAFYGLAVSNDERGIAPFKQYLETSQSIGRLDIVSAKQYANPELYDALLVIQTWWDVDVSLMKQAVLACKPLADEQPNH